MIWSFIKIALFLIVVAAATLGLAHLAEMTGGLRITTLGMEFTLGPLQAVIAAIVLFIAIWIVIRIVGLVVAFLRFLAGDETAITRYFDRHRERKGYQALSEGLLAAASGEGKLAMSKAAKAERYLQRPELTNLLTAQAAEASGDSKKATEVYKRLLADDRTRFVGIRGLLRQKLEAGDTETALKLAQKAYAIKPRHREVQDTLLSLQTETGDWKGAREILQAKMRQGELPRDVHKRRDAVLALQEAKGVWEEGASVEAREAAISAAKASPDLVPAVVMAARAYIDKGKKGAAERILRKAWEVQPHPDLATAFAEIAPDESPDARLKRFSKLLSSRPDHEETRLLKAELNIAAEDFPAARRALGDLVETHPTARSLTIMAAVERGEGAEDVVVRGWLARALTAPRGPQWCCDKCQNIQSEWTPICDNCNGFDTLSWREPQQAQSPLPHGAEMLPLIVGKPAAEPASKEEVQSEDAAIQDAEIVDPPKDEGDAAGASKEAQSRTATA
ncbi:heme biosynthesis protein HemY [Thioclava sp. F1Mire-8]|uniref:heme biosynthesis protein HemY n=1 Tax=Thioclava sp. F1Mire-8 TaxID=1973006 RepID=UPI000B548AC0|nr:heme biosynthesis HemY N-terminal domain-containing protein [Thioclava sp. F1Mire-8]OWY02780.1 heme biosynthesis protein HemY [Thioclava sp. F1Mire-8]